MISKKHPDINTESTPFPESEIGKKYTAANPPVTFPGMTKSRLARGIMLSKDGKQLVANPADARKSSSGKQHLNTISLIDETNEDFVKTQITKGNESVDIKETLLDTGTKLNFISLQLFNTFFKPLGVKEVKTKVCVCVALKDVCQKNLSTIDFFVTIFNEAANQFENLAIQAYILDMPYDFIIGSKTIRQHQLLVKCTSLGYVRKDTVTQLTDYFFAKTPAGEDEKIVYLNAMHKQMRELLSKEEKKYEQEMLDDIEHAWETPNSATAEHNTPEIAGSPELRQKLVELCGKYKKVFSTTLSTEPAKVKPMVIKLQKGSWERCKTQTSARIQSALKNQEIQKQVKR